MKILSKLGLFIALFLQFVSINSHALVNGSFENGLTGWTANAGIVISPYTALIPAPHGTHFIHIGINDISGSSISQVTTVVSGSSNLLSFDLATLGDPGRIGITRVSIATTGISSVLIASATFTNDADNVSFPFHTKAIPFKVPVGVSNITVSFSDISPFNGVAVDPLLDNVRLLSGTNPSLPNIISQPQGATVNVGANVTFTVGVQGVSGVLPAVTSGNLRLRLKADTGVVIGASNRVSQWQDLSGQANHSFQTNTSKQPLWVASGFNGRPIIRFDGIQESNVGDYLQGTGDVGLSAGFSSFIVYSRTDRTISEQVPVLVGVPFAYHAVRAFYIRTSAINNNEMAFSAWGNDYGSGFRIPALTPRIWTERLKADKTQIDFYDTDGINNFTTSRAAGGLITPGSGYFVGGLGSQTRNFQGDIAEIIYYQGTLSDPDRQAVENYLKQTYLQPAIGNAVTYQWRFNGSNIPGATNSSLTLSNVTLAQAGPYSVVVSNAFGGITSSAAQLVIEDCSSLVISLQSQITLLNNSNAVLRTQVTLLNNSNAVLRAQLSLLEQTNRSLQSQLSILQNSNLVLRTQLTTATDIIAALRENLGAAQAANASLQAQITAANAENQQLRNQLAAIAQSITLLEDFFAEEFNNRTFVIPGGTTELQVSNLVSAIQNLNPGQQRALMNLLSGAKRKTLR